MSIRSDALFSCLLADLQPVIGFERSGSWWPGATTEQVAAISLRDSFYKKFVDKVSPEADSRAFQKFQEVNTMCTSWLPQVETWEDELVGELKRSIYEFWNPGGFPLITTPCEILSRGRCGPGASVGARGYDFYTKLFSSPLTATSSTLVRWYESYIGAFPEWKIADSIRNSHYGEPQIVEGSRFHFVPKSVDISRLICVEPTLNMFFQLGFGAHLEDRLGTCFGISLASQPDVSRELARLGSLDDGPNSLVTIDLSSASDSMSLNMLEYILPRDFFSWLRVLRCKQGSYQGKPVALGMVSTMGNGFTFPLQTMLFACIVSASARYRGVQLVRTRGSSLGNFSVFGDDIICPKLIVRDVLRLLKLLGFQVNTQKTFVEGPFRESCGRDYYNGHDVRGVYVRSLKSQQDRYVLINNLNLWSAKTGIYLPKTVQKLMSSVRFQPVPLQDNEDAGIRMPFSFVRNLVVDKHCQSVKYRRDTARPLYLRITECEIRVPRAQKKRIYNPSGLLISFLQGCIRSDKIGVRHDFLRYQTKWGVVPYWDYLPPASNVALLASWQRWNAAVNYNTTL